MKNSFLYPLYTSAAEADVHLERLTARLEAAPFQTSNPKVSFSANR